MGGQLLAINFFQAYRGQPSFTLTPLVFSITCTCRSAFGFLFCVYIILSEAFSLKEDLSEMVRNGIGYI